MESHPRITHGTLLGLFAGLGLLLFYQGRLILKSTGQDVSSSNIIAKGMETRFNELSLALLSYLQNHDAASLKRVQFEGNEAGSLLSELQEKMVQEGNAGAYAQVEQAYKGVWEAVSSLLFAQQDRKPAAFYRYQQKRNAFDSVLQKSSLSRAPAGLARHFQALMSSGLCSVLLSALLLSMGVFLVLYSRYADAQKVIDPLRTILQCVEAAAAGDVSRHPSSGGQGDVGRLAHAVGRLITVLARSENLVYHLATLVDASDEAIIGHTLEGTILSWNKGAQRIYGYAADEMKGQSLAILSPYDSGDEIMLNLKKVRRGERILPFETFHQASNGRAIRAFVRISPILDSTRRVIGASFCTRELSETEPRKVWRREGLQQGRSHTTVTAGQTLR